MNIHIVQHRTNRFNLQSKFELDSKVKIPTWYLEKFQVSLLIQEGWIQDKCPESKWRIQQPFSLSRGWLLEEVEAEFLRKEGPW